MPTTEFYTSRIIDDVMMVTFRQSHILDAATIERMSASVKELVDGAAENRFIFDFAHVAYLSSNALGMLISLRKRVVQRRGSMKLAGINDEVMEIFRITKLDTVFDIYKDAAGAAEAFRKNL